MEKLFIASLWMSIAQCTASCGAGPNFCLPGIDIIGVGFDAVKGKSFGVGLQVIKLSYADGNTYRDPFGNRTVYAYPDQAKVTTSSGQFMGHHVVRSVASWVSTQATWANLDASYGPWFSASDETQRVSSVMSDGLHIAIESRCKLSLYAVTLLPAFQLSTDPNFQVMIDKLPEAYNAAMYGEVVKTYGTHYVGVAEFGGLATMQTVVDHNYYSTTSDAELQAQARIQWSFFGGGGGGGTSRNSTSQGWQSGTTSSTSLQGGNPAIRSFSSSAEWSQWAKSVETSAPVQTQIQLRGLWTVVQDKGKASNLQRAVLEYAMAHNKSWPGADPANYTMQWCDCHSELISNSCVAVGGPCMLQCNQPGFVVTGFGITKLGNHDGWEIVPNNYGSGTAPLQCCRPCFKVSESSAEVHTAQFMV